MMRTLACLLVVASYAMSAPDATPPPPSRGYVIQIHLSSGIEIDGVWGDEELSAVLEHETAADWLDRIKVASEDGELEELDLDPHLTSHAEGITAPPLIAEDLPLQ